MSEMKIEIFDSATHGRGIRTKRDIKPGELLLRDKPFTYILYHGGSISNHQSTIHCDYCLAEKGPKLLRCSGCKYARYCDKTCQRAAWVDHKDECHVITRANSSQDTTPIFQDQIRLMARTHWKRTKLAESGSISPTDENGFPNIPDVLVKHVEKWGQVRQRDFDKGFLQLAQFLTVGCKVEDMKDLFSILQANCVEISDAELKNIGYGLYLKASLFNHACDFNCVATFNSTALEIRATKELKKGEECFISYIELYNPTEDRHTETSDLWYFTCSCAYCEDKDRDARISALKCGNSDCTSAVPFYYMRTDPSYKVKCPSCNWSEKGKKLLDKTWPTVQKMRKNKRMIDNWCKNSECDWSVIKTFADTNISVGAELFHHQNYLMKANLDVLMDACIHLEMWDKALEYGLQSLGPYREFYPEYHPAVGLQCMRVAKLQLFLQHLPEAQKMIQQAHHIINITHGSDHPLMKTLKEMLFGCEEEMRVKRMESLNEIEDID